MATHRNRPLILLCLLTASVPAAFGQDLEPRRWSHLPVDLNVIAAGFGYSDVDLAFDPVLQLEDVTADMNTMIVSYVRSFALAGKSARVDILVPFQDGEWTGLLEGSPASTHRNGFADPRIRLSINLLGAPPLKGKAYAQYRGANPVTTTLGAALSVKVPLGEYDSEKLINLGKNRFTIRPQIGVLHTRGPWSYELTGSVFLYTDNNDFFGGSTLQQDPIFALQAHVVRTFGRGWWLAAGGGWGLGGETEVDGVNGDNHIGNSIAGASFGMPITKNQGLTITYLRWRTQEFVGANSDSVVIGWSVRF